MPGGNKNCHTYLNKPYRVKTWQSNPNPFMYNIGK